MTCCYINPDGTQCNSPVREAFEVGFPSCAVHAHYQYLRVRAFSNRQWFEYFEKYPEAPHSDGYTYFLLMPDGLVKIGYSGSIENLYQRFKNLHRENGGRLQILAIAKGGITYESVMHHRFHHLRLTDRAGERFQPASELIEFAYSVGIHPEAWSTAFKYQNYTPRPKRTAGTKTGTRI